MTNGVITEKDAIRSMLIETSNNLVQAKITERLFARQNIKNQLDGAALKRMGANQEVIKRTQSMIKDLTEFLKEASDENPLAGIID